MSQENNEDQVQGHEEENSGNQENNNYDCDYEENEVSTENIEQSFIF